MAQTIAQRNYWRTPKGKATQRRNQLKMRYGITVEEYDRMLKAQDGVCAICHKPEPAYSHLAVDHCHLTSTVRGLLCSRCNTAVAQLQDSPKLARAAAAYLEKR